MVDHGNTVTRSFYSCYLGEQFITIMTEMDYAVKEMKKLDPESYAIEKKILAPGNSTWNHF